MADLIYGIHPVREALVAKRRVFEAVFVSKLRRAQGVQALLEKAERAGIPVSYGDDGLFRSRLAGAVHQGIAAKVSALPLSDETAMLTAATREDRAPLVLALDGIEDPQNLGAIVRSASAMGAHGIVLPKNRTAPLSAAVSKASAGTMEHVLFARVSNLVASLNRLKNAGLWVVGTDPREGKAVDCVDLDMGLAVVIGGEERGMRPLVRKTCDFLVTVPQSGRVDSLNASIATAIVLYEIGRQRRAGA